MRFYEHLAEKAKKDGIEKIVVGGVVFNEKGEILVLERPKDDFMGGIDELPSGNLEKGESIYDGLIREIKEETNLDVDRVTSYIDSFDYLSSSGKKARQFNFSVAAKGGEVKISEHISFKWQLIEDARNNPNITDKVKETIEIIAFNRKISAAKR